MSVRDILRMGDPALHRVSEPVREFGTPALRALVDDMWQTMEARGGVGLAAPQIGVSLRLVVFGLETSERYPEAPAIPLTVLVNPEIEPVGGDRVEDWEGCLSVPGLRGLVARWERIRYRGFDLDGRPIEREVDDFHARVVQHECDHLDGILYPMRMTDLGQLGFEEELRVSGRMGYLVCDE